MEYYQRNKDTINANRKTDKTQSLEEIVQAWNSKLQSRLEENYPQWMKNMFTNQLFINNEILNGREENNKTQ